MSKRTLVSSGSPYEEPIGFSRAVRIGKHIAVAGTAPIAPDGSTVSPGDLYSQTVYCLRIMIEAVKQAGGSPEDIIRTRIFLADISRWEEAGRAHGEVFAKIRPACTFVEISGLINSEWLVETEADAVVAGD
ncbi:MAG TPA: RidA family protein [Acidobacteriota bacterium]|nr:RidA family protein [Acidobacteriota bacterium]